VRARSGTQGRTAHRDGLKIAHFPCVRNLDGFDFAAQPSVDPRQIRELATCRLVANGESLLLLGPPGVGKSHLAIGLGREAIRQNHSVLFVAAPALVAALAKAHADGRLDDKLTFFAKPKLLIIDGLGYLPFAPNAAHLFFQLVSRRYERGAMLVTATARSANGARCSAIPWWPPPSSIACSTTATS
jgi:DNA replication protein DnaC